MIISLILITGFITLFVYASTQYRRARVLSILMMFISISGAIMSIFPETTTAIANWVGVGRGADLILYCFVLVMLLVIFNLHLRLRTAQETVTEVARAIALMNIRAPDSKTAPDAEAADSGAPTVDDGDDKNGPPSA